MQAALLDSHPETQAISDWLDVMLEDRERVVRRGDVVLSSLQGDLGKPRPAVVVQADELGPTE